jgi:hypothetical protein
VRKWIAAALLLIGAITIPSETSIAQAPDAQGWWWQYRQVELPADPKALVPQFPDTPELPPPASVPEDGLYVAGQATGPEAISALSYVLPEGASADTLTLISAAPLTPTTAIRLCPTNTAWQPVQAGRWVSKPLYQCAADAPVGVVPTDGSKITFTLGKLGQSRLIDIALVPVEQSVFQANFNKPDAKSLNVVPGASSDTSGAGTGSGVLSSGNESNSINSALADPSYTETLAPYLTASGDPQAGLAPTVDFPQQPPSPVAATTPARDRLENFAIFGLIALAALFSRFRNQPAREPRSLVNFGKHDEPHPMELGQ